jgi:beta-glucanase (GH16 family)
MDFFVDDQLLYRYGPQLKTAENWPFNKPVFLILNLAVGGNLGGTVDSDLSFPREYVIDYIRVYQ